MPVNFSYQLCLAGRIESLQYHIANDRKGREHEGHEQQERNEDPKSVEAEVTLARSAEHTGKQQCHP
jgi:hypothetical protein